MSTTPPQLENERSAASWTPLTVLVVEDNPGDVVLVREALVEAGRGGLMPKVAGSMEEAIRLAPEVDAALLDLQLPDAEGLETLLRLRRAAPDLPIVVFSGFRDETVAREALHLGAQEFLLKDGASPETIAWTLRRAVERAAFLSRVERWLANATGAAVELRGLVRGAPDGFLVVDRANGSVLYQDDGAERLLGRRIGERAELHVEAGAVARLDARSVAGSPLEVRACRILWQHVPATLLSVHRADRRPDRDALLQSALARLSLPAQADDVQDLMGSAARELDNVLTLVAGHADLLGDELGRDDRDRNDARSIREATRRGREIVVLLLERSAPIRALLEDALGAAGYGVLAVGDAAAALDRCRRHGPIDAFVVDAALPGLRPGELIDACRRHQPRMRVLATSAGTAHPVARTTLPADLPMLRKPFTAAALLSALRELLDSSDSRELPPGVAR